jgi:hypothetical protein
VAEPAGHLGAQFLRAADHAGHVVANVHDGAGGRRGAEHGVERRHPVGLGRRDRQPLGQVVERARADPADALLHRVQHGDQEVAAAPGGVPAERDVRVFRVPRAALPAGERRPEYLIDGGPFLVGRGHLRREAQVH